MKLDKQLFSTAAFATYAKQHLILVKLDFPMRKKNKLSKEQQAYNDKLSEKYNSTGVFPLVLIFKGGVKTGTLSTNLPTTADYIKELKTIVK